MRIRSIKPSIHTDEDLWDLEQQTGLPIFRAFTGLWAAADREGRFEWRPRALKAAILPYWEGDFSRVLDALSTRGFVVRYASQGKEIGVVRTFTRHQVVNNREQASVLPPPPESTTDPPTPTRGARVNDASVTPLAPALVEGNRKGREQEGSESARDASESIPIRRPQQPLEPLEERFRIEFEKRFTAAAGTFPNGAKVTAKSREIVDWIRRVAELRKMPERDVLSKLLDGFFSSAKAAAAGFPPGFLAENPTEYFEPKSANGKAPPPGAAEAVTKLGDQLKQLRAARVTLDKSDPDYMSKIYDSDRDISQTQERLDRMRRKLEGAA